MSDYDLVIRNGTIVDGTRLPAFKADLAIKRGRIAQISGRIAGEHKRELDATGCYVAPGAIDLHCHYDAQVNWDPYCTLSGWHGITSLTIGQCGFGFAPVRPEDRTDGDGDDVPHRGRCRWNRCGPGCAGTGSAFPNT